MPTPASLRGLRMPGRIMNLPLNKAGYPVPWFVAVIGGAPDFRVIKPGAIQIAQARKLCWICGTPFQRQEDRAFLIGPMCALSRTAPEPPSHEDCATYAARACPFLATPRMVRRDKHMPASVPPAGHSLLRNPGCAAVWVTGYRDWSTFTDDNGGTLFNVGAPKRVAWYAEGRAATRDEVLMSIDSGLPILRGVAEDQGQDAIAELEAMHAVALTLVPQ